ncbi:unnamed protein product, partial [Phaeothamnion confervicola]
QWSNANRANHQFLEYDPVLDDNGMQVPPPMRQAPVTMPLGMLQEGLACVDAIKGALGMFNPQMGNEGNEVSGKAIIQRQVQGDNATFHFIDNLAVALRHVGRITVDIIPIVYTGQRIVRIMGEDGKEGLVPLGRPVVKQGNQWVPTDQQGKVINFDAKYDVIVEVGPTMNTRNQELANAIIEIARVNPEIWSVAGDMFIKALNLPNGDEIAKRIRATMDPALLGDDIEA